MLLFMVAFLFSREIVSENVIEVDDILSPDFMPGNLLILENPQQRSRSNVYENITVSDEVQKDGSVNAALSTMGYHR